MYREGERERESRRVRWATATQRHPDRIPPADPVSLVPFLVTHTLYFFEKNRLFVLRCDRCPRRHWRPSAPQGRSLGSPGPISSWVIAGFQIGPPGEEMEDFSAECEETTCSICLESFAPQNPATTTVCKHEYHLQCIIEWSQRSRECPICWRSLSLSDPASQELLAGQDVVRAARLRASSTRRFVPFPEFESADAEDQDDAGDFDMEEYMTQQMRQHIEAIAMSQRHRSSSGIDGTTPQLNHSQQLLPRTPSDVSFAPIIYRFSNGPSTEEGSVSVPAFLRTNQVYSDNSINASTPPPDSPRGQNRRFSELSSFSGSLKSKLSAASSRYKDSLSRGTRGLKDKLLVHNNSLKELSKEVKREVTASFAGVARMMARVDLPSRSRGVSSSNCSRGTSDAAAPGEDDGSRDKSITQSSEVLDMRKLPMGRRGATQVHDSLS